MRILVVDADPMFRSGVISLLLQQVDIEVVGEAQEGAEAVKQAQELKPDVILMDVHLPGLDGLMAARQIKEALPHMKILMCTGSEKDEELMQAIQIGTRGYLHKRIEPEVLYQSLRRVFHGEVAISQIACTSLWEEIARLTWDGPREDHPYEKLSLREQEILMSLAKGESNKEIASTLSISENTVKSHLKHILTKLRLKNRVQAAAYALRCQKYHQHTSFYENGGVGVR